MGSIDEWGVFKDIIDCFCKSYGMLVTMDKSMFIHPNPDADICDQIKSLCPYRVEVIDRGFKYLGFHLKPNYYTVEDWNWLVHRFDKMIKNWTHQWLSLGGRLVLVNSVLHSLSVYWLSLVPTHVSVLNAIRRKICHFLWTGGRQSSKFHLSSWESLSLPKHLG